MNYLVARLTDSGAREALQVIASIVDREIGGELLSAPDLQRFVLATDGHNASERFGRLAGKWREETMVYSSLHDIVLNDSYQQIIGMGPSALPYIVEDLKAAPDHWGWALKAITGTDPIKPSSEGNLESMRTDWLKALNVA